MNEEGIIKVLISQQNFDLSFSYNLNANCPERFTQFSLKKPVLKTGFGFVNVNAITKYCNRINVRTDVVAIGQFHVSSETLNHRYDFQPLHNKSCIYICGCRLSRKHQNCFVFSIICSQQDRALNVRSTCIF